MPPPLDTSQPRLAAGCRWGATNTSGNTEERVILFPEGAIKLQGTGRLVLEPLQVGHAEEMTGVLAAPELYSQPSFR